MYVKTISVITVLSIKFLSMIMWIKLISWIIVAYLWSIGTRSHMCSLVNCITSFTIWSTFRCFMGMILRKFGVYCGAISSFLGLQITRRFMVLFIPMLFYIINCCELGIRIFVTNVFHWILLRISRYLFGNNLLQTIIFVLDWWQIIFEPSIGINLLIPSFEKRAGFI